MSTCDVCGKQENMPYQCRHCGGTFCSEHRLPEAHDCPGLDNWGDPDTVFDSGFDDSVEDSGSSGGVTGRVGSTLDRSVGGWLGYFRGNASYTFLGLIWITFFLQFIFVPVVFGVSGGQRAYNLWDALFVLSPLHVEYVWTWFTSIFAHGGLYHIAGNSIVLYFFGPVLERQIGSKKFAALFIATGAIAGLSQILAGFALGTPSAGVLGASGAIMGILGVLTVLAPNLKVYLYFILPIPLWVLTIGYAGLSLVGVFSVTTVMGNVAHAAHLSGLVLGLVYGEYLKRQGLRGPRQLQFGTGGRRGGGGPGGPGGRGPF
ncbi:rhomboid family intramembrane serine protease [Halobacteriales archaeon Cl-PHB]